MGKAPDGKPGPRQPAGESPKAPDPGAEFRAAVGAVRPLRDRAPRVEAVRRRAPSRRPVELPGQPLLAASALGAADTVRLLRPGLPDRLLARLDGERFEPDAELDLHGLTAAQAAAALGAFIDACRREGCEWLRIIHGKGRRSEAAQPVLKALVLTSLTGHPAVLALRSAGRRDGGSGAVRVLLRRG